MSNFLKNIWFVFKRWDDQQTNKRKNREQQSNHETYSKEAMEKITVVPDKTGTWDGYYVIMDGFIVSDKLKADEALRLVDLIRTKYIEKKMNSSIKIWY